MTLFHRPSASAMAGASAPTADPPTGPLVRLDGISRRFGKATPVRDVSLTLNPGEFLAVLGPNGAGKSTLLAILDATLPPTGGTAWMFGQDPWTLSERERSRMRARIGVVPQRADFNPLIPLTVWEVVAIGRLRGRAFSGRLSAEDRDIIEASLDRMGATALARRVYRSLSGGEQQKTQLARALAQEPAMLLLDEPASGLDLRWQEQLIETIGHLSETLRLPIVMTTHILSHLPACCRRAALMRDGAILYDGPVEEALSARRIGELYGCPVEIVERDGRLHCLAVGAELP